MNNITCRGVLDGLTRVARRHRSIRYVKIVVGRYGKRSIRYSFAARHAPDEASLRKAAAFFSAKLDLRRVDRVVFCAVTRRRRVIEFFTGYRVHRLGGRQSIEVHFNHQLQGEEVMKKSKKGGAKKSAAKKNGAPLEKTAVAKVAPPVTAPAANSAEVKVQNGKFTSESQLDPKALVASVTSVECLYEVYNIAGQYILVQIPDDETIKKIPVISTSRDLPGLLVVIAAKLREDTAAQRNGGKHGSKK